MAEDMAGYYKAKRDENLNNRPLAAFYQILIVQEEENRKFTLRKRSTLAQLKQILKEMLDEVLQIYDAHYQKGICLEVILSGGTCLSEKGGELCSRYFGLSGIQEYVQGAYQIHINGILDMAREDIGAALQYAENLLGLIETRYGHDSEPYARMKLHIMGEVTYWYDREAFLSTFGENYDYFRRYAMPYDSYFFDAMSCFALCLWNRGDEEYESWIARYEEDLRLIQNHEMYRFYQCKIAYIKARECEKEGKNEEGLFLTEQAILEYLERDSDRFRPFYAYVYLIAAYFSMMMMENKKMLYYAQQGLDVCEKANQKESEVYYSLSYYIGVWYMRENNWVEAEKFFGNAIPEIARKLGKENENYILYMNNLALVVNNRGGDAILYHNEIKEFVPEGLRNKYKKLMNNELNYFIAHGDSLKVITDIYKKCLMNLTSDDFEEKVRLDTLYLSARVRVHGLLDEETEELLKELEDRYKGQFANELATSYWVSKMVWEWKKGRVPNALKIAERLMQGINVSEYVEQIETVINYIHLLLINGQYTKAEKEILNSLDVIYDKILETGYGNPWRYLCSFRMLLSMYIQKIKKGGTNLQMEDGEGERLLEQIIHCKTIEREIKGLMGKYHDDQMDLYYFRQAHRKLAALEMMHNAGKIEPSDYDKKRMKYLLEIGEYESSISGRIPFGELIHEQIFHTDNS